MTPQTKEVSERALAVRAANEFKSAISLIVASHDDRRDQVLQAFPKPTGLGTDGTCWTRKELVDWLYDVANHASRLLSLTQEEL